MRLISVVDSIGLAFLDNFDGKLSTMSDVDNAEADGFAAVELPKIFLRRKLMFIVEDEDGGRIHIALDGMPDEQAQKREFGDFEGVWEQLKAMHSKFYTERPLNDYKWSGRPLREDD